MRVASSLVLIASLWLGACGNSPACDNHSLYQEAVPGKRVEMLDGMDPLPPEEEMTIPEANAGAPPPPGECVDSPPTLRTADDEEDEEDGE